MGQCCRSKSQVPYTTNITERLSNEKVVHYWKVGRFEIPSLQLNSETRYHAQHADFVVCECFKVFVINKRVTLSEPTCRSRYEGVVNQRNWRDLGTKTWKRNPSIPTAGSFPPAYNNTNIFKFQDIFRHHHSYGSTPHRG